MVILSKLWLTLEPMGMLIMTHLWKPSAASLLSSQSGLQQGDQAAAFSFGLTEMFKTLSGRDIQAKQIAALQATVLVHDSPCPYIHGTLGPSPDSAHGYIDWKQNSLSREIIYMSKLYKSSAFAAGGWHCIWCRSLTLVWFGPTRIICGS